MQSRNQRKLANVPLKEMSKEKLKYERAKERMRREKVKFKTAKERMAMLEELHVYDDERTRRFEEFLENGPQD